METQEINRTLKSKKRKRTFWIITAIIISGLIYWGWTEYKDLKRKILIEDITTSVKEKTNEEIKETIIIQVEGNKYVGLITFKNGLEMKINVTVDDNGAFMWESDGTY